MSTTFHKTPPPWFEFAKNLQPGSSTRVGDSFKISFNGHSYQFYDFRDKVHEVYEPTLTLQQRIEMLANKAEATQRALADSTPPEDCMLHPRDWPADARIWFYENRMNDADIARWKYCWSPSLQRVILPFKLLQGGSLFIARDPWWSRSSASPKYLRPPGHPGAGLVDGTRRLVVLTEDLVSAQRINDVTGAAAVPLMGTSLSRYDASAVADLTTTGRVMLWLDPDDAGANGQSAVRKALRSFDLHLLSFDRFSGYDAVDPKKLRDVQIGEVIAEALNE